MRIRSPLSGNRAHFEAHASLVLKRIDHGEEIRRGRVMRNFDSA
jgi:hypothetical protein